jgi:MFS family permease
LNKNPLHTYAGLPREVYYLFAARLTTAMGSFIFPLLTLILTQKLSMSTGKAGNLISILMLSQAPCLMLGGKLADTVGRKKLLVFSQFVSAFFFLLCFFEPTNHWLVLNIVLAADIGVMAHPTSDALLADIVTPEQRKSAYSLLYFGVNIGMAFSMILGGLLFQNHLKLLFFLDAFTTILCTLIILFRVKEHYRVPHAAEEAALTDLASEKRAVPDGTAPDNPPAAPAKIPSLTEVLRAAPILIWFVLLTALFDFCYSQFNFLLPAQMGTLYGAHGAKMYSMLSAANCITVIVLTPSVTAVANRFSPLTTFALSGALFAAGYLGFSTSRWMWLFMVSAVVFTIGEILSAIQTGTFIASHTPVTCRGRVTAFNSLVRGAGSGIAPSIMGSVLALAGYRKSWLIIASIALCGAAGMWALRKLERSEPPIH